MYKILLMKMFAKKSQNLHINRADRRRDHIPSAVKMIPITLIISKQEISQVL